MWHGADIPDRAVPHGVFANNPSDMTNKAWDIAVRDKIVPSVGPNGNLVYDIPFPNAGIMGGRPGKKAGNPTLHTIRIVTQSNSNKIVTAFPK